MNTCSAMDNWEHLTEVFPSADRSLPNLLIRQAKRYGDRRLASFEDLEFSYTDALEIAARGAATLKEAGVQQGDRVVLMCGNRPEFLEVFLGAAWMGAVTVPLNTASKGSQLMHMLSNSSARVIIAEPQYLERLSLINLGDTALEQILSIGTLPETFQSSIPFSSWDMATLGSPAAGLQAHDPIAILYTSGTTGPSKGVVSPHAQYFWTGFHGAQILGLQDGEILLTTLPLFHMNALGAFFQALLTGSTLVIERRFSVSGFLPSLIRSKATVTYLLGAMVPILLSIPKSKNDTRHHLRIILAPGVPSRASAEFSHRFGTTLVDGFASTESNFVIGCSANEQRSGTMGRVRPGVHARVVDDHDDPVPAGAPGELVLRADDPFVFSTGYFGMPEKTIEAWRNLWLHTGDRVSCDEDGYFRFIDRIKDSIRRRGENISSFEVEQVILTHPAVQTAAVFPVQSELAEDEVMASVVLHPSERLTADQLLDHCQPLISYFSLPRYIDFVPSLPMTENGKIKKFQLREIGVTPTTWDRDAVGYTLTR